MTATAPNIISLCVVDPRNLYDSPTNRSAFVELA